MLLDLEQPELTRKASEVLALFVERFGEVIQTLYDPETVILFGSYAQGNQDEWSDIDLLVVSSKFISVPNMHRRSTFLIETGLIHDHELFVEPHCVTPEEFQRTTALASIQREALRTGIVLLDRHGLTKQILVAEVA